MDSTPTPTPTHPISISIKAAARKLPIKRKIPDPNPNPTVPKLELSGDDDETDGGDRDLPPFKYHRIWTETDEIRFLQGLVDCSTDNLSFPRDLHVFYARFSQTMSQPYTKSQLSEKLRRLRKKFRVISARLARGVDYALLSLHDRALFELSKTLWHPDCQSFSPFGKVGNDGNDNKKRFSAGSDGGGGSSSLVGVNVSFSPTLPLNNDEDDDDDDDDDGGGGGDDDNNEDKNCGDVDSKMNEVKIDYDFGERQEVVLRESKSCLGGGTNALVVDVFDEALKEVRAELFSQGLVYSENGLSPTDGSSSKGKTGF